MVESSNRMIKLILKTVTDQMNDWERWLWAIMMAVNSTKHASTGNTPSKLFLSRREEPWLQLDLLCGKETGVTLNQCESQYILQQRFDCRGCQEKSG